MTDDAPASITPTPSSPMRSRRRLIIGIAAGLCAIVVFLALQFGPSALNADAVVEYVSEAEHYSVMAPGEPTLDDKELIGAITTTTTRWIDDQLHYSVSSTDGQDLPPSMRGMFLHAVLLEALSKAPGVTAASLETSAVTDAFMAQPDETTLSGGPAFRFLLAVEGAPAPFHVVFAGHGTTLYMLVLSESADSRDEEFIDSFEFTD